MIATLVGWLIKALDLNLYECQEISNLSLIQNRKKIILNSFINRSLVDLILRNVFIIFFKLAANKIKLGSTVSTQKKFKAVLY